MRFKRILKNKVMILKHFFNVLLFGLDKRYGEIGFFSLNNPITNKYTYSNWGSRLWEIYLLKKWLQEINIKNKNIVDLGIGLPSDSNFFKFYVESDCNLLAYDPDSRISGDLELSEKCKIKNKSSEDMQECADESVDVVVALSSLEHYPIEAFNKTIKEVFRILKKDGQFLVTLDLTIDKQKSARWAILEKTINKLPSEENDRRLGDDLQHLTLDLFLNMISPFFYWKDGQIKNKDLKLTRLLTSKKWNSYITYIRLYKK